MDPATAPTPLEQLLKKFSDSPTPLTLKDATKGLVKTGKNAPPAPDFATLLEAEIRIGRIWKYPSGANGTDRYWVRDEKELAREAALAIAGEPRKLADIEKTAKEAIKGDKAFAAGLVDEMVAAGLLHKHPGKSPLFGRDRPPPRNDKAKVAEAILTAAAVPAKLADLVKAAQAATPSDKEFVTSVAQELIAAERLYQHGAGKSAYYGREKPVPPHPFESGKAKTAYTKLVTDARKLLVLAEGVAASELLDRLRTALERQSQPATPAPVAGHVTRPVPATTNGREHAPAPATPEAIRSGLRSAYDELRRDVEFQDGVVELGSLFHEVQRSLPTLTVESFHRELLQLQRERAVELQPLNEVQRARDPELAIRAGDRLLYFAIWR
jgi:hypothetical protein